MKHSFTLTARHGWRPAAGPSEFSTMNFSEFLTLEQSNVLGGLV